MTTAEHIPGRLGPYRLLDRLGEGGMGVVYLARDAEQRSVAVKILRPAVAGDPNARRRLAREVETMRRVRSPYVAEVLDTDVTGDTPYIVTRYVPGRTLEQVVGEEGPLSGARLARLAGGLAEALAAIHAAGVVHRDLKPGNVMLVGGDPVVIDFGIAQALDSTRLTMTGMFMGTPGYLSPEVIEGQNSTAASDVHAWAATVAFAATGRPPFGTGAYETIFYRILNGRPDLSGVPAPMAELLATALHRDPAARPPGSVLASRAAALDPAWLQPVAATAWAAAPGGPGTRADALGQRTQDAFAGRGVPGNGVPGNGVPGNGVTGRAGTGRGLAGFGATTLPPPPGRPVAQPGGPVRADDFADVLPPVSYAPAPVPAPDYPARAGAGERRAAARGPATAGLQERDWPARRQPLLVVATMVILVALAVVLPVAGTALALGVLVLLRAGDLAHRGADQRSAVMTAAAFPFFVVRSVISTVLRAPLALIAAVAAAGVTYLAVPGVSLARAVSYAAGALIACYAFGPGAGKSRRQLGRVYTALIRSPGVQVVAIFGVAALAVAIVVAALTSPAAFWPLATPTGPVIHLPSLPGLFGVRLPTQIGGFRL
jgi:serine/threonine kinase PknH